MIFPSRSLQSIFPLRFHHVCVLQCHGMGDHLKVLVCGEFRGRLKALYKRVDTVLKKQATFHVRPSILSRLVMWRTGLLSVWRTICAFCTLACALTRCPTLHSLGHRRCCVLALSLPTSRKATRTGMTTALAEHVLRCQRTCLERPPLASRFTMRARFMAATSRRTSRTLVRAHVGRPYQDSGGCPLSPL